MSGTDDDTLLEYLRRVTAELQDSRRRLRQLRDRADEPIAIIGTACRFPGGIHDRADLWRLLDTGGDVAGEFPTDRGWDLDALFHPDPDRPGSSHAHAGGFLADAAGFDAEFFGIGPREALAMDPQHRLLLELAWSAVEDSGIAPHSLAGSRTAVFAGLMYQDYGWLTQAADAELGGYRGIGAAASVAAGRIAYTLGLHGPAVTVDTACSSSLVATHLGVAALRRDECDLALVGGATLLATPGVFTEFSRQGGVSRDGRCRSFAEGADGTGWAEGGTVLALARLSDAQRLGHRVLAVIRGSAVNADGASNGLTAPNGPAQERVIRAALAASGLTAADVDLVEGHGTGTSLGDPIELGALLATYGRDRPTDAPVYLGSVKSNLGHTQAAAGVAGVLKAVLALRHGRMPRSLHAEQPTSRVDWSAGGVALLSEARPWPAGPRPRRAAVSSFGISGTNAHLILEEAPPAPEPAQRSAADGPVPVLLSARSAAALREQAARLRVRLAGTAEEPEPPLVDVAHALAAGRTRMAHRAVLVAADRTELRATLDEVAAGGYPEDGALGVAGAPRRGVVALFTGQGSQRAGMGRELARRYPVFAEALEETCAALDAHHHGDGDDPPVRLALAVEPGSARAELLHRTGTAQRALFAVEVALFRLLESWGLRIDFALGHSIGELVAAHVAGMLSLPDAARLVSARARLMQALPGAGVMVAVQADAGEAAELIAGVADRVAVAAVNGPESVVLSGDPEALDPIVDRLKAQGRRAKRLAVSHAFHSPQMDPMLTAFEREIEGVSAGAGRVPVVSNLTGLPLTNPDAGYWARQVRGTVRFLDGVRWLAAAGAGTWVEFGPHGVLTPAVRDCLPDSGDALLVPTLSARRPEVESVLTAAAELDVAGVELDWPQVLRGDQPRPAPVPTYPFQHRRFWPATRPAGVASVGLSSADDGLSSEDGPAEDDLVPATSLSDRAAVAALVTSQAAAVLGHSPGTAVPGDRRLLELGFDSMGAVNLHRRLARATGLDLPARTLVEHPTLDGLTDHLWSRLGRPTGPESGGGPTLGAEPASSSEPVLDSGSALGSGPVLGGDLLPGGQPALGGRPEPVSGTGPFTAMLRTAAGADDLPRAVRWLGDSARYRPSYATASAGPAPVSVLISDGPGPTLVCLPSFLAGSGPHQFARFAAALPTRRRTTAVQLPGFGPGEPLPRDWDALMDSLCAAVLHAAGPDEFLLVGYSIGGVLAQGVAGRLAGTPRAPHGLVMLDTFEPGRADQADTFAWAMGAILNLDHEYLSIDDDGVLAMGGYLRALDGWTAEPAPVPTLLVHAEPTDGSGRWPRWQVAGAVAAVSGDHFSLLQEDVKATAAAVDEWLTGRDDGPDRR
ncbi:Acyl transferase domain-containing protein [Micromonospora pallida]|uniref:Acyl transferase domain-containing protein n=1 Tax=Micromonospora pallida TaxID=145854 RepID=A0A1C6RJH6_9ACTN|nr:type I polyketide synthase [Micromonospora pallida]SCL17175.1 Acyl transferase domain-containing protein [Micromonospora pallida]